MELLFRSVARAGGIELPPEARFFAAPNRPPRARRLAARLARALKTGTQYLFPRARFADPRPALRTG